MTPESGYDVGWIRKNYNEYLQTEHWQNVRKRYRAYFPRKGCFLCGSHENLNLHHKTYKRVGRERLGDLMYLCRDCHLEVHEYLKQNKSKRINLWTAANYLWKDKHGILYGRAKTIEKKKKLKARRLRRLARKAAQMVTNAVTPTPI